MNIEDYKTTLALKDINIKLDSIINRLAYIEEYLIPETDNDSEDDVQEEVDSSPPTIQGSEKNRFIH